MKVVQLVPVVPDRCALAGMGECTDANVAPTHEVTWPSFPGGRRVLAYVCERHALRAGRGECNVKKIAR